MNYLQSLPANRPSKTSGTDERRELQYSQLLSVLMPHREKMSKIKEKCLEKNPTRNKHVKCGFNDILNSTNRSRILNTIFFKYTCSFMDVPNESNLQLTT